MKKTIIAAIGSNRELGNGLKMLWHLPADFKHFKETTMGHPMIMGSNTFDSLPGVLKGRHHIVMSKHGIQMPAAHKDAITVVDSLYYAMQAAREQNTQQVFIVGGGMIYKEALDNNEVHEMVITEIDGTFGDANVFFPVIDMSKWNKVVIKTLPADVNNSHSSVVYRYTKK